MKQLSGGQRVAIVRDPRAFLLDEPLSNLDAALRLQTRLEIANLRRSLSNLTMICVTHDQAEAITLADRIAVPRDSKLEQVGSCQPVIVRRPGKAPIAVGAKVSLNLQTANLHRFDADGKPIR